jgi:hypothetical protein
LDWVHSIRITPDGAFVVSSSKDNTLRVWDIENGNCLAVYQGNHILYELSKISPGWNLSCGTSNDGVLFLKGHNFGRRVPIITAFRIASVKPGKWKRNNQFPGILVYILDLARRLKRRSDNTAARCPWCGQTFLISIRLINLFHAINLRKGLSSEQIPSVELNEDAWDSPGLLYRCGACRQPFRFNPFIAEKVRLADASLLIP